MALLDQADPLARVAGAVNALRRTAHGRIEGALFDGEGFVNGLDFARITCAGRRVLVLGTGGAAAAIAASLLTGERGTVAELAFFDPAAGRAQALAQRLGKSSGARVIAVDNNGPAGFDLTTWTFWGIPRRPRVCAATPPLSAR